jgi:two-component system, OmpR family, phosphate regulon sensor histidine kinase PhoR
VPEDVIVDVDREMIGRVLGNLIHNAIKFTPDRGRITIGAAPADGKIKVSVADTGAGIPAEDLPRIFERFYKVDRARGKSGTGLGLAIARHVVEAHGGRIWAESVEGKGATFYFTIPAAR